MKLVILDIQGMSCIGCMNTVRTLLEEVDGVISVELELVPGEARVKCENEADYKAMIDAVNHGSQYHAAFVEEMEIFEE